MTKKSTGLRCAVLPSIAAISALACAGLGHAARAAPCEDIASVALDGARVVSAQTVPAGPFGFGDPAPTFPPNLPAPALPAFCRVVGTVQPAITFEVWLPLAGWNGKLQGIGNHGFAGDIPASDMAPQLLRGYAVAGTDTGHSAKGGLGWMTDAQQLVDYGYRGIHEMTLKAKAVVARFYGQAPRLSYFNGCSTGGKQGMTEAQRFPTDYDGIASGDPNLSQTHNRAQYVWTAQATFARPETTIPPGKLPLIHRLAVASCDVDDKVRDGVITDPRRCRVDVSRLLCAPNQSADTCLTAAQVDAVRKVYAGPRSTLTGEVIYPGFAPGSELGWKTFVSGPDLFPTATQFYGAMVFGVPDWDYRTLNWGSDIAYADAKTAATMNAVDPDLSAFRDAGGKIVGYHGLADDNHTPFATMAYYDSVLARMAGGPAVQSFYRLFLAPGQDGCGAGGEGANRFDPMPALEAWVEHGTPPDTIIAKRYAGNDPQAAVERTRPLCPYPLQAHYSEKGDPDDAANFACRPPP